MDVGKRRKVREASLTVPLIFLPFPSWAAQEKEWGGGLKTAPSANDPAFCSQWYLSCQLEKAWGGLKTAPAPAVALPNFPVGRRDRAERLKGSQAFLTESKAGALPPQVAVHPMSHWRKEI